MHAQILLLVTKCIPPKGFCCICNDSSILKLSSNCHKTSSDQGSGLLKYLFFIPSRRLPPSATTVNTPRHFKSLTFRISPRDVVCIAKHDTAPCNSNYHYIFSKCYSISAMPATATTTTRRQQKL